MFRTKLLTVIALTFTVTAVIVAQEEKNGPSTFAVEFVLSGANAEDTKESIENKTFEIDEAVVTDIPIRQTFRGDGIETTIHGLTSFIPSPKLMRSRIASPKLATDVARKAQAEALADAETIPIGPQLTCRIRRGPNGMLLLDATLADTVSRQHDPYGGILDAVTRQLRSVQPVRAGQPVTLSWPSEKNEAGPRQVTITILDAETD